MSQSPAVLKIHHKEEIPACYRLMTVDEFLVKRDACLKVMSEWAICLLADGKCDGAGYKGVGTRWRDDAHRNSSITHNERIGELMLIADPNASKAQIDKTYELRDFIRSTNAEKDDAAVGADKEQ